MSKQDTSTGDAALDPDQQHIINAGDEGKHSPSWRRLNNQNTPLMINILYPN
jgi:hypothetical protein